MCELKTIFSSAEFWKIAAPAFVAIIVWVLNERSKRKWEMWQIKKAACLKALNLADAVISNYTYPNVDKGAISPQYESIENARACYNELACTCKQPEVINELKRILFGRVTPDAIVDLRNAVRRELGFGSKPIDTDREKAFMGRLVCEKDKAPQHTK